MTVSKWFAPTDGISFDTRIEGPIDGQHLFGDQDGTYADGFEKLALLEGSAVVAEDLWFPLAAESRKLT